MGNLKDNITKKITDMKPIPAVTAQLLQSLNDPKHSARDIAQIVQCDSILASRVLQIANSASIGVGKQITSVDSAIAYLGEQLISGVALSMAVPSLVSGLSGYQAKKNMLWNHNLKTAIAARFLARKAKSDICVSTVYTGGLLHDIGKIVLADFIEIKPSDFKDEDSPDFLKIEENQTGTNHCQCGKLIFEHWKLPQVLQAIAEFHHSPADAPDEFKPECYIIHLADIIAMQTGEDTGVDCLLYKMDAKWPEYVSLDKNDTYKVILQTIQEFEKATAIFHKE